MCSSGTADAPPPGLDKPKMASLFKTMTLERITLEQAKELLSLPRVVGVDPADGQEVTAANGRYGPVRQQGQGDPLDRHRGAAPGDHPGRRRWPCWPSPASSGDGAAPPRSLRCGSSGRTR